MNSARSHLKEDDLSEYLNTLEAAIFLRIFKKDRVTPCTQTIRNMLNSKKLKGYKPFGSLLFKKSELQNQIECSRIGYQNGNHKVRR